MYLVKPASREPMAAALMCSGVSKSGSPAPKPTTSRPSAFMLFEELGAFGGIEGHGLDSFSMGCRWFGTKTITKWGMKSNLLSKRCAGGVSGGGLAEAAKGFAD